jgi:hypothetical protein
MNYGKFLSYAFLFFSFAQQGFILASACASQATQSDEFNDSCVDLAFSLFPGSHLHLMGDDGVCPDFSLRMLDRVGAMGEIAQAVPFAENGVMAVMGDNNLVRYATNSEGYRCRTINLGEDTSTIRQIRPISEKRFGFLEANGKLIIVNQNEGETYSSRTISCRPPIISFALSSNGEHSLFGFGNAVHNIQLRYTQSGVDGDIRDEHFSMLPQVKAIEATRDCSRCVVADERGDFRVIDYDNDFAAGRITHCQTPLREVAFLALAANGKTVVVGSQKRLLVYKEKEPNSWRGQELEPHHAGLTGVAVSDSGDNVVVGDSRGCVTMLKKFPYLGWQKLGEYYEGSGAPCKSVYLWGKKIIAAYPQRIAVIDDPYIEA